MKTAKLVLIATILVFTTVSISNADGFKVLPISKIVNVTLVQAIQIPGLPAAMVQQLNPAFLGCGCQSYYTQSVSYDGLIFKITGTGPEWTAFFNWSGVLIGIVNVNDGNETKGDL